MNADEDWPFDQPRDCAVFTLRSIVFDGAPVLHVSHDAEDHGWQFLGAGDADANDAAVVSLASMIAGDPSLREVADLPPGWQAWRSSPGGRWARVAKGADGIPRPA